MSGLLDVVIASHARISAVGCASPCDAQGAPDGVVGRLVVVALGVLLVLLVARALWTILRRR